MVLAFLSLLLPLCVPSQDQESASLSADLAKLPPPSEEQTLALETLNGFRALHALAPVRMDPRLNASAALHATSMAKRSVLTHKDDKDEIASASQRAQKYGYDKQVMELVASGMPDSPFAVVTFIDAPYHRRLLLKPGQFEFGCATQNGYSCFVLGGTVTTEIVKSPPNEAEGVPTWWDGREEPNPMRGTGSNPPFGYPILLSLPGSTGLKHLSSRLTDANGTAVDIVAKHPANDSELRDGMILVPRKPLKENMAYAVEVEYSVEGQVRAESWVFKTGASTLPVKPAKKTKKL